MNLEEVDALASNIIETKPRKPRTEAQLKAFELAREKRLENINKKKILIKAVKAGIPNVEEIIRENAPPKYDKNAKPKREVAEDVADASEAPPTPKPRRGRPPILSSIPVETTGKKPIKTPPAKAPTEEREIIYKKKPKVVYVSSSEEEEEEEPEPQPIKKKVAKQSETQQKPVPLPAPTHLYSAIKFF